VPGGLQGAVTLSKMCGPAMKAAMLAHDLLLEGMHEAMHACKIGARPIARLVGHATHAQQPEWFSTAPMGAVQKLLARTGWGMKDVDLWEVNETFAVVPMALMHELDMSHERVNVRGGACALGHPIGLSGARIMVTLIHARRGHAVHRRRRGHGGSAGTAPIRLATTHEGGATHS